MEEPVIDQPRTGRSTPWRPVLILVSIAAAVAVISWLPSVGARKEADGKTTIEVWSWNIAAMSLDQFSDEFEEENPDTDIFVNRNGTNMTSRLLLSLAGGVGAPDVSQLQEREAGKFTATGTLADLSEYADQYADDFSPAFWASCQHDGKTYAIPWDAGPCAVFYKRWVFEQYNIDPDEIETWDDFIEVGQRIVKESGGKTYMMPLSSGNLANFYQILMQQAGGGVYNEQGQIIIQCEANLQALEVLRKLLNAGITRPIDGPEELASFGTDSIACYPAAVWVMQQIKDFEAGTAGKWGVFRLPALEPGGLRTSNLGGSVLVIPAQGHNIEKSWRFVELTNCTAKSQVLQYKNFGLFPAYLPALEDPYFDEPDPFFDNQPVHRIFTLDFEKLPPLIRTGDWNEAERYLAQTLSQWHNVQMDNKKYLDDAAATLARKLGREVKNGLESEGTP